MKEPACNSRFSFSQLKYIAPTQLSQPFREMFLELSMFHSGNLVLILTLPTSAPLTKLHVIQVHFLSCKIPSEKGF